MTGKKFTKTCKAFLYKISKLKRVVRKNPRIDLFILFIPTLLIYLHNLSPGVYGGDSGDFLSAIIHGGVPHPSGYPLYTILGRLALLIPLNTTVAWKVGVVSALFSSISLLIMYSIIKDLTGDRYLAVVTCFALAFLYPFWLYAEVVEVFALNNFFVLTLLLLTIKYIKYKKDKHLYLLALLTGLSLTNNLTILMLFPAIGLTIFLTNKKLLLNFRLLAKLIIFFILGLTPYLYIPLTAVNNTTYNWGVAININNFLNLIFRKEYGWGVTIKGFNLPQRYTQPLSNYYYYLTSYISPTIPILSLLGIVYLFFKRNFKILTLILVAYFFLGPFFLVYTRIPIRSLLTIATLEKFYLAGFIIMTIAVPFGIIFLKELTDKLLTSNYLKKIINKVILIVFLVIPLSSLIANFNRLNFNQVFIGDNLGVDILSGLPLNSYALLTGDSKVFNSYYIQNAYDIRSDIYIPGRPDSFVGLLRYTEMNEDQINDYIVTRGGTIDQATFVKMLPNLMISHGVFTDHTLQDMKIVHQEYGKVVFIPYGLVNKIYFEKTFNLSKEEYLDEMNLITGYFQTGDFSNHQQLTDYSVIYADIQMNYSHAYLAIADFIANFYGDEKAALPFLKKSIALDPLVN